jgi:flagellar motor switch protein FliN/FliY
MTVTMHQAIDSVAAMVESAAQALEQAMGTKITATKPAQVADVAEGPGNTVLARSILTNGTETGGLVTIVPSSGMASTESEIDAAQLIATLVQGASASMTQPSGAPVQAAPAEPLAGPGDIALDGAQAFRFEIKTASASIAVVWVVEASLGVLLGDGDPVDPSSSEGPSVAPATLPELTHTVAPGRARDLQLLADVAMNVTVEIGRGSLQVRELLALVQGSIVELDRVVGAPVDVLVNGTLVAHGDIVLVGDDLGVRLTEIVEPA